MTYYSQIYFKKFKNDINELELNNEIINEEFEKNYENSKEEWKSYLPKTYSNNVCIILN
jgi:hypothetical protein